MFHQVDGATHILGRERDEKRSDTPPGKVAKRSPDSSPAHWGKSDKDDEWHQEAVAFALDQAAILGGFAHAGGSSVGQVRGGGVRRDAVFEEFRGKLTQRQAYDAWRVAKDRW